jgi:tetratricopeptide (TPR) repeat protein
MRAALGVVVAASLWAGAYGFRNEAAADRSGWPKAASTLLVPPVEVMRFAPYRELVADLLWCRLLVYYGSNWLGDGDLSQVEDFLDDIVVLAPRFKAVYEWASFAVTYRNGTANQEEFHSSIRYLEKAMREFPDDYKYFWLAGTRYYLDLWSPDESTKRRYRERGAELIEQAMTKLDAPQDLVMTAANMRGRLGQHQRALDNLRQMILSTSDEAARAEMLKRVRIEDPGLADELEKAARALQQGWLDNLPSVPLDFYILLGKQPSPVIDFRKLATPHDLFGVVASEEPD